MAIIIAEYLGKRTDSDVLIEPFLHHTHEEKGIQFEIKGKCPFNGLPCKKMDKKSNAKFPICSLRRNEELYIVCEHRLASTSRQKEFPLSPYQTKMLLTLARELFFEGLTAEQILYKTELIMSSGSRADYMLSVTPDVIKTFGPRKLIVEMQGGGETSDTGNMTAHLVTWTLSEKPTNVLLSAPINVGLIQTNAWRRLQEQILTKGSVAEASGNGFVACIGSHLFELVKEKADNFNNMEVTKEGKWDMALVAYKESKSKPIIENSVALEIDRIVYLNYKKLATQLINRGEPDLGAFGGTWWKLTGEAVGEDGTLLKQENKPRKSAKTSSPNPREKKSRRKTKKPRQVREGAIEYYMEPLIGE